MPIPETQNISSSASFPSRVTTLERLSAPTHTWKASVEKPSMSSARKRGCAKPTHKRKAMCTRQDGKRAVTHNHMSMDNDEGSRERNGTTVHDTCACAYTKCVSCMCRVRALCCAVRCVAPRRVLRLAFNSFHFISFHFISFHFISFHFISYHFISFHFIPSHTISFRFVSFRFISFTCLLGV